MGNEIFGGYALELRIGAGAMGVVWRARRVEDGEIVALKVMREDITRDQQMVKRFLREAEALMEVTGPHVASLRDLVTEGDTLGLVTEFLAGGDLRSWLATRPVTPPADAAHLVAQVLDGLASVHAAGIVHRDVKPENTLLRVADVDRPDLVLSDFGVARLADLSTITHGIVGTPYYLAPEIVGGSRATPAADLYSAGILLYELLAGAPPFRAHHPLAVMRAHVDEAPAVLADCPGPLWRLLAELLAKGPGDRPDSATEARDELQALAETLPPVSPRQVLLGRTAGGLTHLLHQRLQPSSPETPAASRTEDTIVARPTAELLPLEGQQPPGAGLVAGGMAAGDENRSKSVV